MLRNAMLTDHDEPYGHALSIYSYIYIDYYIATKRRRR